MAAWNKLIKDFKFENENSTFGILTDGKFFVSKVGTEHLHEKLSLLGFTMIDYREKPIAHYRKKDRWTLIEVLGRGAEMVKGDILGGNYVVDSSYRNAQRSSLIQEAKRRFPHSEVHEIDWMKSPGWTEAKMDYLMSMVRLSDDEKQLCPECRGLGLESVAYAKILNGMNSIEKKDWDCRTCFGCSYVPKEEFVFSRAAKPRVDEIKSREELVESAKVTD